MAHCHHNRREDQCVLCNPTLYRWRDEPELYTGIRVQKNDLVPENTIMVGPELYEKLKKAKNSIDFC